MKNVIVVILLVFVVASVFYLISKESGKSQAATNSKTPENTSVQDIKPSQSTQVGDTGAPKAVENPEQSAETKLDPVPPAQMPSHRVIAYYFYGTKRCPTCLRIEDYAKQTINGDFKKEVESGLIEFKGVNVETPGNEHFMTDFKLTQKTVVLAEITDGKTGKWVNLSRVWELNNNKDTFVKYVQEETRKFMDSIK
jgi:hypothetical protein